MERARLQLLLSKLRLEKMLFFFVEGVIISTFRYLRPSIVLISLSERMQGIESRNKLVIVVFAQN
jgi:hypothetical protein